ncbi:LysR family transcriptional regulator [Frigoribacterium faeni]|uniref:DNA-binding transcriptional LysR family regulator n=1 Tax=Frigoribacterium faeni TaxID=145483 RepID=A0A7W3PIA8_9MICO|nr:LysR family transcriptional regulator [Frigoribacterium faeni]MBA8812711.1 DNA-binding transcriptional LysR family regulator [Frigoribacterium faeni]BFF13822.1 LysR family transcriptional regulator [Microbacterium flavescens]GEK82274.1 LysR family transcriptional regulator [Frigoribacterium faeni]
MSDDLDLQTLRVVRALADAGTITAAAARLGYSQPAVSQHLRRAEARMGHPLVLRTGRGVRLTEAGMRLAEHAVHVQAALDAARQELDQLGGAASGRVRLTGFPSASSTIVPDVLSRLRRRHPGLQVAYVEAEPPEALALLRDGTADVALTFTHPGAGLAERVPEGLHEEPAYLDRTVLVVPDDHAFSEGSDFADLADARWIGGCPRCRGHLLASCAASGFAPDIVLETDNALAVLGLVAAGMGVALLPRLSLQAAAMPQGVRVVELPTSMGRRIGVVHRPGARRVPSVRAVTEAIRALDPRLHGLTALGGGPEDEG